MLLFSVLVLVVTVTSCLPNISQEENFSQVYEVPVIEEDFFYQDENVSVNISNIKDSWCAETEIVGENGTILISLIKGVDNLKEDFCHIHVDDNSGEISDTYFNEDGTVSIMKNYNSTGDLILKIVRDESGTYIQDEAGGVTVLPP